MRDLITTLENTNYFNYFKERIFSKSDEIDDEKKLWPNLLKKKPI